MTKPELCGALLGKLLLFCAVSYLATEGFHSIHLGILAGLLWVTK